MGRLAVKHSRRRDDRPDAVFAAAPPFWSARTFSIPDFALVRP